MSEKTFTMGYGQGLGYTYHHDRDLVVAWPQHNAKRYYPEDLSDFDIDWYTEDGDDVIELDGPTETY